MTTTTARTIDLTHTVHGGICTVRVVKLTKATVFVEHESGTAERYNRTTGKRVGGNYTTGDLIITPADLQRIAEAEAAGSSAPADATTERDTDDVTVQPKRTPAEVEAAAAEQRELLEQGRPETPVEQPAPEQDAEGDDEEGSTPGAKPRAKGELRIDTREIVDTAARVGRAATRCRRQAEFFEAVGTSSALTVAGHLRAAQKAYEAAAALAPSVKLASKEGGSASAPKGLQPGATVKLNEAGAKVFSGVLTVDHHLTVKTNRGRVIECTTTESPAPLFIERKYLVASEG